MIRCVALALAGAVAVLAAFLAWGVWLLDSDARRAEELVARMEDKPRRPILRVVREG